MLPPRHMRQNARPLTLRRGFSLLELMLATGLFAVVAGILLVRLGYYQEAAEKAAMEYTIAAVKSAMRNRMAELMVEGRVQECALLAQQNPMEWLDTRPENYAGRFDRPDTHAIAPGSWYFDASSRTLVYLVKRGSYFQPDSEGMKRVRLKMILVRNRSEESGGASGLTGPVDTVTLHLLEPYRWML